MRITYRRFDFTKKTVRSIAGGSKGICILSSGEDVIYIGRSDRIEKYLNHFTDSDGQYFRLRFLTNERSDFNPDDIVRELLQVHQDAFGKLPECNAMYESSMESAGITV